MAKKYPLEPLHRVREDKVDSAQRELAQAGQKLERSRAELSHREHREGEHDAESKRTRDAEARLLDRGELSAQDLMRGAAWDVSVAMEKRARHAETEDARQGVRRAESEVEQERSNVARARADAEVVARDRARFEREEQLAITEREEESAEEAHLARRYARNQKA